MINPAILKLCRTDWQVIIQVIYGGAYLGLSIIGIRINNIYGFAIAGIIANIIRIIIMYTIGDWNARCNK